MNSNVMITVQENNAGGGLENRQFGYPEYNSSGEIPMKEMHIFLGTFTGSEPFSEHVISGIIL